MCSVLLNNKYFFKTSVKIRKFPISRFWHCISWKYEFVTIQLNGYCAVYVTMVGDQFVESVGSSRVGSRDIGAHCSVETRWQYASLLRLPVCVVCDCGRCPVVSGDYIVYHTSTAVTHLYTTCCHIELSLPLNIYRRVTLYK